LSYFYVINSLVPMKNTDSLKESVKHKYARIAMAPKTTSGSCCGEKEVHYSIMSQDYSQVDGYVEEADLSLGCGIPTEYAGINNGDRVLDLGSGAGNDVFVARRIVGEKGWVTGLDFTREMVDKALKNKEKLAYPNVEFILGDIEKIPLPDQHFDVVISNCVLNLVPDKKRAFAEIKRVLKNGGHFCVSDIVLKGELPDDMRQAASLYAGCVSGALQKQAYLDIIRESGFRHVEIKRENLNHVPDEYLLESVSQEVIDSYRRSGAGIFSITVVGTK